MNESNSMSKRERESELMEMLIVFLPELTLIAIVFVVAFFEWLFGERLR